MKEKQNNSTRKKEFEIPAEGSLGLLAIGYKGLMAWRKKRDAAKTRKDEEKK